MDDTPLKTEYDCQVRVERMLKFSQTKLIMPTLALGVLRQYVATQQIDFTDSELRRDYEAAVEALKTLLGHDVHIGAKYEDAYGMRMSRYSFLTSRGHLRYRLNKPFAQHASALCSWLPNRIKQHIEVRVGIIPQLADSANRLRFAEDTSVFIEIISKQLVQNATGFEIVSFALIIDQGAFGKVCLQNLP